MSQISISLFKACLFITPRGKNNKTVQNKIIGPTQNNKFDLPDGSHFAPYICQICVRFVFKIKDRCKLELQTPEDEDVQ